MNAVDNAISTEAVKMIRVPVVTDPRGDLAFVESGKHVPFEICRIYYLFNVPENSLRGGHAHKKLEQVIFAISGTFRVKLDDGLKQTEYVLNDPRKGLYLRNLIWRELDSFSKGAICMVVASDFYDEDDYIRDYNVFKRALGSQR